MKNSGLFIGGLALCVSNIAFSQEEHSHHHHSGAAGQPPASVMGGH